jgi:hypothetical protein
LNSIELNSALFNSINRPYASSQPGGTYERDQTQ